MTFYLHFLEKYQKTTFLNICIYVCNVFSESYSIALVHLFKGGLDYYCV